MKTKWLMVVVLAGLSMGGVGAEAMAQAQNQAPPAADGKPAAPAVEPVKPAPAIAVPASEVLENPYGIEALWKQGDFVARGTLIILIIMSVGTWYIGIVKLIEQNRLMKDFREADAKFWAAKGVQAGAAAL